MSANRAWMAALCRVLFQGELIEPRGMATREVLCDRIVVDMTRPIVTNRARQIGYKFMAAEAAWILSGDDRVSTLEPYSRTVANFSDDGVVFRGAYGPKIVEQMPYVLASLRRDRPTRQAIVNIWRETPGAWKDIPCTLSTQFLIRDGRLHQIVTMRSSDLWLGVPYDVFSFSMLAGYVLIELGDPDLRLGNMYHTAGSRHLYERDWAGANLALSNTAARFAYEPFDPALFPNGAALIEHLRAVANHDETNLRGTWMRETTTLKKETDK